MLTILDPKFDNQYQSFQMVFDLENIDFKFIEDKDYTDPVDILICNHFYHPGCDPVKIIKEYSYKRSFLLDIKHNSEDQIKYLDSCAENSLHEFTVTNAIDFGISNPKIVFYDFLFNRTKAYYSKFQWSKNTPLWYYESDLNYQIPVHPDPALKNKIFIAPNKSWNGERKYRTLIVDQLLDRYSNLGYIGDPFRNLMLHSQLDYPAITSVADLILKPPRRKGLQGYSPPHIAYYQDTFISVYGETIEYGNSIAVTEKTFDPLTKGHFILPFSNCGFVKFLTSHYGFKLPEFINYSYDAIEDPELRFKAYTEELDRLMNIDINIWRNLWIDNQQIINYNQEIFYNRQYHRINFEQFL